MEHLSKVLDKGCATEIILANHYVLRRLIGQFLHSGPNALKGKQGSSEMEVIEGDTVQPVGSGVTTAKDIFKSIVIRVVKPKPL